jgi:hypothetical protein
MLALVITLLTALYLVGPDFVSRLILGWVVPRRIIQQSRSEEVARAILTSLIPLTGAVLWASLRHAVVWESVKPALKTVFSGLYSEKMFEADPSAFFSAAKAAWFANLSIAWRLYLLLIAYAFLRDIILVNYGAIRNSQSFRTAWSKQVLAFFVLPGVSEWYILLSSFSYKKSTLITVDILTKSGVLYRGTIEKPFLGPDGSLSGILLSNPERYERERYLDDVKAGKNPNKDEYWRKIPSQTFFVFASEISNINLRHYPDPTNAAWIKSIETLLDKKISALWGERTSKPSSESASSPDAPSSKDVSPSPSGEKGPA